MLVVLGSALLTSCIALNPQNGNSLADPDGARQLKGRITYKSPEESFSAIFTWKSKGSAYELKLRDRLGLRRVRIIGNSETADIEMPGGQLLKNVNLQAWLAEEIGIAIPILELPDCLNLECRLVTSGQNHKFDERKRLVEFEYRSWRIKPIYDSRTSADSDEVSEIQLLSDETEVRMIFDN